MDFLIEKSHGEIKANFDDLKSFLENQMVAYTSLSVDESNIAERKKDLSALRKLRKRIDEKRLETKKEYQKPLVEFETKVKDLLSVIDKPITLLDAQLKELDAQRVEEKEERIKELYESTIGDYTEFIPLHMIRKPDWTNKSVSDKAIIDELQIALLKVQNEINAIKAMNSPIEDELIELFKTSHDLATVMKRSADYLKDVERIKEQEERIRIIEETEEELKTVVEDKPCEEVLEYINKTELKTITIKASDYDRAVNVLTFNDIEIF